MIHPAEADALAKRQESCLLKLVLSIALTLAALAIGAVMSADMKRPPLTPETLVHE